MSARRVESSGSVASTWRTSTFRKRSQTVLELRQRVVSHLDALRRLLALAAVDDDGDDRRGCSMILLHQKRIGESAASRAEDGDAAYPGAAYAPEDERGDGDDDDGEACRSSQGMKGAKSTVMSLPQPFERRGYGPRSVL